MNIKGCADSAAFGKIPRIPRAALAGIVKEAREIKLILRIKTAAAGMAPAAIKAIFEPLIEDYIK